MKVKAFWLAWLLRFYPPFFFQRIWIMALSDDFKSVRVKIIRSFLNRNYNSSIFGGTIYAATDAFYPILFHQLFTRKGYRVIVWVKSAQVQYIKPGRSNLYFNINLNDQDILAAKQALDNEGKFVQPFPVELYNKQGEHCASVSCEVYIRNLDKPRE